MLLKRFLPRPEHALAPGLGGCTALPFTADRLTGSKHGNHSSFVTHSGLELSEHLRYHSIHFMPVSKTRKTFPVSAGDLLFGISAPLHLQKFLPKPGLPGQGQGSLLQDEWQLTPQLFDPVYELLGWIK